MHRFRASIASSNLFGFDGRVSSLVRPKEFEEMTLFDMYSPRIALRLAGNIQPLFVVKVIVLLLNGFPLLFSQNMGISSKRSRNHFSRASEMSFCIKACNSGGIGSSGTYYEWVGASGVPFLMLNSYELVRLGYVVVGIIF